MTSGDHYYWEGCEGGCVSKVYTSFSVDPSVIKTRARSWCCHFHNSMKEVRSKTLRFFLGTMVVSEEVLDPPPKKQHPQKRWSPKILIQFDQPKNDIRYEWITMIGWNQQGDLLEWPHRVTRSTNDVSHQMILSQIDDNFKITNQGRLQFWPWSYDGISPWSYDLYNHQMKVAINKKSTDVFGRDCFL